MDHYFSARLGSEQKHKLLRFDGLVLKTASGVFSKDKIDRGTRVLLKHAALPKSGRVLDLGCGYGVVGVWVKKYHPGLEVVAVDVNQRAVGLAKANAKENGVEIDVRCHDGAKGLGSFDAVLLNPPQHAGKKVCLRLIDEAAKALSAGGVFFLVARTQKGGKSLAAHMEDVFGNVVRAGGGSGFSVYRSKKS